MLISYIDVLVTRFWWVSITFTVLVHEMTKVSNEKWDMWGTEVQFPQKMVKYISLKNLIETEIFASDFFRESRKNLSIC